MISAILVIGVQFVCPMRLDHALAMVPQFVSMFLLFCPLANLFSIYAPVFIAAGSLKPANPKLTTVLLQLVLFIVLFPLSQGLTLIPLGVEAALRAYGLGRRSAGLPAPDPGGCVAGRLLLSSRLGWLGSWLQSREQKILETVTNRGA